MKVVQLIHDLTQLGYKISFTDDFSGMLTVNFSKEGDRGFNFHSHIGYPDCMIEELEQELIEELTRKLKNK